jgi:hypothetical protein
MNISLVFLKIVGMVFWKCGSIMAREQKSFRFHVQSDKTRKKRKGHIFSLNDKVGK